MRREDCRCSSFQQLDDELWVGSVERHIPTHNRAQRTLQDNRKPVGPDRMYRRSNIDIDRTLKFDHIYIVIDRFASTDR